MKKIKVNQDRCISCGACVAIDPEHFDFDESNRSSVISNENLESENLTNAIESCPTSAIEIVCEESKEDCNCENCNCSDSEDKECDNPNCHCEPCTCEECHCNDDNE